MGSQAADRTWDACSLEQQLPLPRCGRDAAVSNAC